MTRLLRRYAPLVIVSLIRLALIWLLFSLDRGLPHPGDATAGSIAMIGATLIVRLTHWRLGSPRMRARDAWLFMLACWALGLAVYGYAGFVWS